eukprot:snap_masked-scaffold_27-processed-gene-4.16-mRNA-1 protein AED:1.00 eAED:1.00 QI:0/0/0/0/1/1/2/0/344
MIKKYFTLRKFRVKSEDERDIKDKATDILFPTLEIITLNNQNAIQISTPEQYDKVVSFYLGIYKGIHYHKTKIIFKNISPLLSDKELKIIEQILQETKFKHMDFLEGLGGTNYKALFSLCLQSSKSLQKVYFPYVDDFDLYKFSLFLLKKLKTLKEFSVSTTQIHNFWCLSKQFFKKSRSRFKILDLDLDNNISWLFKQPSYFKSISHITQLTLNGNNESDNTSPKILFYLSQSSVTNTLKLLYFDGSKFTISNENSYGLLKCLYNISILQKVSFHSLRLINSGSVSILLSGLLHRSNKLKAGRFSFQSVSGKGESQTATKLKNIFVSSKTMFRYGKLAIWFGK